MITCTLDLNKKKKDKFKMKHLKNKWRKKDGNLFESFASFQVSYWQIMVST